MVKNFLILISLQIFLYSYDQVILVVSDDLNSSKAKLSCFEGSKQIFETINVNIGRSGLAWGIGIIPLQHDMTQPLKYEGDKKAPIGVFRLTKVFGYKTKKQLKMPYLKADKELICIDDSNHKRYNQIIKMPFKYENINKPNSFEYMKRDDHQYELGVVVEHNKNQLKGRGSCIFLHVQKTENTPTAGCTSMDYSHLNKIVNWLDISKNPILIQIPKSEITQILKLYPQLNK